MYARNVYIANPLVLTSMARSMFSNREMESFTRFYVSYI